MTSRTILSWTALSTVWPAFFQPTALDMSDELLFAATDGLLQKFAWAGGQFSPVGSALPVPGTARGLSLVNGQLAIISDEGYFDTAALDSLWANSTSPSTSSGALGLFAGATSGPVVSAASLPSGHLAAAAAAQGAVVLAGEGLLRLCRLAASGGALEVLLEISMTGEVTALRLDNTVLWAVQRRQVMAISLESGETLAHFDTDLPAAGGRERSLVGLTGNSSHLVSVLVQEGQEPLLVMTPYPALPSARRLAGRGRCALASRTFSPGEVVLEEDAWAVVLLPDQQGLRCDYSLTCLEKLLRCPSTGLCFASKEDQKAAADLYYKALKTDWVVLKLNCLADSCHRQSWKLQQRVANHLRLAWRVLQRGAKSREQPWLNLESHWDELSESQQCDMETSAARCLDVLAASLGILDLEEASPEARQNFQAVADLGDVARLVAAMEVNAMTVTDEELREIALGLYIHAAVFNHDEDHCDPMPNCPACPFPSTPEEPNCIQSFVGRRVVIRTIREVFEGEELCLAYAEIGQLSRVRHGNLWKHFHFRAFKTPQVEKRDGILSCVLAAPDWQPVEHGVGWDPDQGVLEEGAAPDALAFLKEVHHCWSEYGCNICCMTVGFRLVSAMAPAEQDVDAIALQEDGLICADGRPLTGELARSAGVFGGGPLLAAVQKARLFKDAS
eukprot:g8855.t1